MISNRSKYPLFSIIIFLLVVKSNILAETINSIVATVESQAITDYDLQKSPIKTATNLLDQEIFTRLIKFDAKRNGISTSSEEINFYLEQVAKNQGLSSSEFFKQQQIKGLTAEAVRAEMELEILKQKLALKLFQNSKQTLAKKEEPTDIAKVNLSQIIIDLSKHSNAEVKKLLKKINAGYKSGQTFQLLVDQYSDDINKQNKGLMGEINWNDLDPKFQTELAKISPEELTSPIKKGNLIFIFKLNQIITAEEDTPDESEDDLSPAEINSLLKEYFSKDLYKNYLVDKK